MRRGPRWALPEMMRGAIEGRTKEPYEFLCDGINALLLFPFMPPRINEIVENVMTINTLYAQHFTNRIEWRAVMKQELPERDVLDAAMALGGLVYVIKLIDEHCAVLDSMERLKEHTGGM